MPIHHTIPALALALALGACNSNRDRNATPGGAETATLFGNREPEIPGIVHLAEVLERKAAVAVDPLGAGGERPGQRIGEGDELGLALGPGKGIVHVDQCYRLSR